MVHPFLDLPRPHAIAHRGGASDGTENTIAAFVRAYELGYRYLETDVRRTADGELVVFHDATLERVTGIDGQVSALTWAQLSALTVGGREPIPRLVDLLERLPDARFIVDPKTDDAVDPLIAVLSDGDTSDRVCVGSFSGERLDRLRAALGSRLCSSLGPWELGRLRLASWRLLPSALVTAAANCVQMPLHWGPVPLAETRLITAAQRRGLAVQVWTINDRPTMHRLLDLGVDGIITDDIGALRDVLRVRGAWHVGR